MAFKLGKLDYEHDERTLKMAAFVNRDIQIPKSFDYDQFRAKFPLEPWGNLAYGNCVIAGRCNHLLRLERSETKRTVKVTANDVINKYKELSGTKTAGDSNDKGLVVLQALNDWRNNGWTLGKHNYKIQAFGSIPKIDLWLVKAAIYLFDGVQIGFNLPRSAQSQTKKGFWEIVDGPDSEYGSWGGHLTFSKRFSADGIYVLTWGMEVKVSNDFFTTYADEVWTCIDSLDSWRKTAEVLNVDGLIRRMHELGINPSP